MSRDPHREIRRHLAAEAYQWRRKAMHENRARREARAHLQALPDLPDEDRADQPAPADEDHADLPEAPDQDHADQPDEDHADLPAAPDQDHADLPEAPDEDHADLPEAPDQDHADQPEAPDQDHADQPEPLNRAPELRGPIVVGYDGTAGALPALAWALDEAQGRDVPLKIVRAWQWDEELAGPGLMAPEERVEELAHSTLPDWAREADGVSVIVAPRAAGPAIITESADAALIVVGRRRLGALQRAWLGSTSSYVVQHAPCPVVVVPETAAIAAPAASAQTRDGPGESTDDGAGA